MKDACVVDFKIPLSKSIKSIKFYKIKRNNNLRHTKIKWKNFSKKYLVSKEETKN